MNLTLFGEYLDRYVFVAPRMPEWLAMLTIFKYTTWLLICGIFMLSVVSWYLLGVARPEKAAHKKIILCVLNTWAVFLGIATNNRPFWNPLRIFFVMLTLYSLNITTVYTSKLINVFTNPAYEDQIDTIEEIINSHLPIGNQLVFTTDF